jgi:hypothetical protein
MQGRNINNISAKSRHIGNVTKYRTTQRLSSKEAIVVSQVFYALFQLVMSFQVASEPVGTVVANMDNRSGKRRSRSPEFREEEKSMKPRKTRKEVKATRGAGEMRNWLHHNLNSLHIYCRLVRVMPRWLARKTALQWEKTAIYALMYADI